MIKIVKELPPAPIMTVDKLRQENTIPLIAAYKSANSDAYCVLVKLSKDGYRSGFAPLNGAQNPRYVAENAYSAIEKASQSRTVYIFKDMNEMLTAMVKKLF